jgi:hypothetical protein
MVLSLSEHITGLFVAGYYYWFIGNDLGAESCWEAGVAILPKMVIDNPRGMQWLQ